MKTKPVLFIQHAPPEHPAALGRALDALGIPSCVLHPYRGEAYPSENEIAGIISLGGAMGANDEDTHPWITRECELLHRCIESGMPAVGICLGGQLIARALGGRVEKHDIPELGWHPVKLNEEGARDPLLSAIGSSARVYQWHYDTFHLPPGARLLAGSEACPRQAYRIGEHAYGFQFHAEADSRHVKDWLALPGAEEEILSSLGTHGPATVQHPDRQRQAGLQADLSTGALSAAIASHFGANAASASDSALRSRLKDWAQSCAFARARVALANGAEHVVRAQILGIVTIATGEFVILRDEAESLWPVRLDRLTEVSA